MPSATFPSVGPGFISGSRGIMKTFEINNLELKLDALVREYYKILKENKYLREQLATLKQDHGVLADKNQLAVTKIKHVISQLRDEIHERIL